MSRKHIPVMLQEVLQNLSPVDGGVYIDATFGDGGYSQAILDAANCKVIAIDRDPNVIARANELKQKYGERFEFCSGCFGDMTDLVKQSADGIVFDIGVSSMQIDNTERGFSYSKDAALDMRMSCEGLSAFDLVNTTPEKELADIIYRYGEEKKSRKIAARIVAERQKAPINTTRELAEIIYHVIYKKNNQPDPATRTFQALRIAVNDELEELKRGLNNGVSLLKAGGKMVVVTFHSLEDRIVKNFFNEKSGRKANVSRYLPEKQGTNDIVFAYCSKSIKPTAEEVHNNSRAHSAKLRYAIKKMEAEHE